MWAVCLCGVLVRFLLYHAGAPTYLEEHLELTNPTTSYVHLKECLFLLDAGTSPYEGGTCRYPPLLLFLLYPLRHSPRLAHFTFVVVVDVVVALLLRLLVVRYMTARRRYSSAWADAARNPKDFSFEASKSCTSSGLEDVISPAFVGLSYLLNPFTIASCLAHSFQNVQHLAFISAVVFAAGGRGGAAAGAVALALYVCPYTPIVLVVPVAYLAFKQRGCATAPVEDLKYVRSKDKALFERPFVGYLIRFAVVVGVLFCCLLGASLALMGGSSHFIQASFISVLTVQDFTPNVGIWWYIFIEVFDRYRALFLVAFHGHILFYPLPLHLRLAQQGPSGAWVACVAATGIIMLYKPYPTASDFGLVLSMMLVHPDLISEAKTMFAFLLSGLTFGLSMFPSMAAVWLTRNAGNANFLYNMTLVVNIFGSLLLCEFVKSGMMLRRRQNTSAFCRGVISDVVESALTTARPAQKPKPTAPKAKAKVR